MGGLAGGQVRQVLQVLQVLQGRAFLASLQATGIRSARRTKDAARAAGAGEHEIGSCRQLSA